MNLRRRSLADRDTLLLSLRGLRGERSSGQQAPGRHVWPLLLLFFLLVISVPWAGEGSEHEYKAGKVYRVGWLNPVSRATGRGGLQAFRQGLRERGWVEGQNIVIEDRWAEGKNDRLPALAAELVHLKVDVILATGPPGIRAAMNATRTIPIVFAVVGDPVASGFVNSLARPGGNATGLTDIAPEITGKLLELLKEAAPGVSRLAVLSVPTHPVHVLIRKETLTAAAALGFRVQLLEVPDVSDFEPAFGAMKRELADALFVIGDEFTVVHRHRIAEFALANRLPVISHLPHYVRAGGFMFYGPSFAGMFRDAARYVDKILKGTDPADLPVERPMKIDLVINLKTAKALGLTIPDSLLFQADEVIR